MIGFNLNHNDLLILTPCQTFRPFIQLLKPTFTFTDTMLFLDNSARNKNFGGVSLSKMFFPIDQYRSLGLFVF